MNCETQFTAGALVGCGDRGHFRDQISLQQQIRDFAKVDSQVADSGAVGYGEVGRHPNQEFVQRKSLRPKGDQLAWRDPGETLQLVGRGNAGKDIVAAKNRRQVS